eukprot:6187563-Pleurochrysis_carterae.AAC.3
MSSASSEEVEGASMAVETSVADGLAGEAGIASLLAASTAAVAGGAAAGNAAVELCRTCGCAGFAARYGHLAADSARAAIDGVASGVTSALTCAVACELNSKPWSNS